MAGEGIEVTPEQLRTHADHVAAIGGDVTVARQAGNAVRLGAGAYGQLCAFMPTLLNHLQDDVLDGLASAATSLTDASTRLRLAAVSYEGSDARAAAAHDAVRDRW